MSTLIDRIVGVYAPDVPWVRKAIAAILDRVGAPETPAHAQRDMQTALVFLNAEFEPWTFQGDEPVALKLAEILAKARLEGYRAATAPEAQDAD